MVMDRCVLANLPQGTRTLCMIVKVIARQVELPGSSITWWTIHCEKKGYNIESTSESLNSSFRE